LRHLKSAPRPRPLCIIVLLTLGLFGRRPVDAGTPAPQRFEFNRVEMGLPFRVVLYAGTMEQASAAATAAFARISQLNEILSDYDAGSEVSRLSRTSGSNLWVHVSADLWHVLYRARRMGARTAGAFDPSVGPVVNLWRKARREQRLPDPNRLRLALAAVGYEKIRLNRWRHTVRLTAPNMRLDFGGIAKGYAIDQALATVTRHGIRAALVAGGGDMAVSEPPPGRHGWRVQIGDYDNANPGMVRTVEIANQALTTSGDTFQFVEIEGVRYSHIVDPRTGIGLTNHSLVTVIARDCIRADSWSTALSVLGALDGARWVRRGAVTAARWIELKSGGVEVVESPRFKRFYR